MFDPATLRIRNEMNRPAPWFVGIRRAGEALEFCVPQGFEDYPVQVQRECRTLFFQLYRTLRIFEANVESCRRRSARPSGAASESDDGSGAKTGASGAEARFRTKNDDEDVLLHARLPALDEILEAFDAQRIARLMARPTRRSNVGPSRMLRLLDRGRLHNAVVASSASGAGDLRLSPRSTWKDGTRDLVRMYCYIYVQIKHALDEAPSVPAPADSYARAFQHDHLSARGGLFTDHHAATVTQLKQLFQRIEWRIQSQDAGARRLRDAVETFLFRSTEVQHGTTVWGISTFAPVWEDMCLTWIFESGESEGGVLFADPDREAFCNHRLPDGQWVYKAEGFDNPFYIERRGTRRYLRPDLVKSPVPTKNEDVLDEFFVFENRKGTCHIRVKERNKLSRLYFDELIQDIRVVWEYARRRRPNAWSWSFPMPSQAMRLLEAPKMKLRLVIHQVRADLWPWGVYDFKYKPASLYQKGLFHERERRDLQQMMVYERVLRSFAPDDAEVESVLDVPRYFAVAPEALAHRVPKRRLHRTVREAGVQIDEVDFMAVQEVYHRSGCEAERTRAA